MIVREKKTTTGRKCTVCTDVNATAINSAISSGRSFRVISRQFWGDEKHHDSVRRHTENCLKLEVQALIKEKKVSQAFDHHSAILKQIEYAEELRSASRKYLADPETDELLLFPRSTEITVIYDDYTDKKQNGEPKRKKGLLSELLDRARTGKIEPVQTVIKHVDIRTFALEAIRTTDTVVDKFARVGGLYTKERENDSSLKEVVRKCKQLAEKFGTTIEYELDIYINEYATAAERQQLSDVSFRRQLISEAIN